MDHQTLQLVVTEIGLLLPGRFMGKIYQLSNFSFAIEFGLKRDGFLFISVEPDDPRLYIIKRSLKELERGSKSPGPFAQALRATLSGAQISSITQDDDERVVRISLNVVDEIGDPSERVLVAQLTGRSANLFLLDQNNLILHAARVTKGDGQSPGQTYLPPTRSVAANETEPIALDSFPTVSAALDALHSHLAATQMFAARAASMSAALRKEIAKQKKLKSNLENDLRRHGNPEEHKRLGDLLLANIATAERAGDKVQLKDYYAEGEPTLELEIDRNTSLQDAAGSYFSRYTKAKRAIEEITDRVSVEMSPYDLTRGRITYRYK